MLLIEASKGWFHQTAENPPPLFIHESKTAAIHRNSKRFTMEENKNLYVCHECGDGTLYTDCLLPLRSSSQNTSVWRGRITRPIAVTLIYQEHPDKSAAMSAEAHFKEETVAYIEEKRNKSPETYRF